MPDHLVRLQSHSADERDVERAHVQSAFQERQPPVAHASRALQIWAFSATALAAIGLVCGLVYWLLF